MKKREKTNKPLFEVRNSKIHGRGIYATTNIKKGTKVIEYIGEIISKKEGNKRAEEQYKKSLRNKNNGSVYVFELNKKNDIDGSVSYNTARFINHSCEPNCKYKIIKNHIWIISIKDIKKGEEIYYDYFYDLEDYFEHPCKCGKKSCLGYIVGKQYRNKLKKLLNKKLNKKLKKK